MANDKIKTQDDSVLTPVEPPANLDLDNVDLTQSTPLHNMCNFKQITDIVQPSSMEEKLKPITERQDKTIDTLENQINIYRTENQSLKHTVENISSQLQEESMRREIAETKQALAETKLNAKEWKSLLIGGFIGIIGTIISQWLWEFTPKIIELLFHK